MFDSFVTWMFMPGTWNDAMVFLGVLAVVGFVTLIVIGE